jgi:hypothetical protein
MLVVATLDASFTAVRLHGQTRNQPTGFRITGASTNLDEPPDEAVGPDPQGHELVVPSGQTHDWQPTQLSLGPEAGGQKQMG